ncbi:hypothetical protein CYMTET_9450 [Cymbomonas tetramitiformis]|uniref:Uncharacterized protein n=1 Tax=Cymbomonas tetramitiformis TaxID=36881 RepID=A0AAE0GRG4_9CHLO|nr:hypothetical protein CYMTET_9450 [Cymbomonas tetramitiformis]
MQVFTDADHARDKCDAEMASTGSEYVAASVVGQKAVAIIHMRTELFGTIRIAQQQSLSAVAMTISTATKPPDGTWQQRALPSSSRTMPWATKGQSGLDSPLLPGSVGSPHGPAVRNAFWDVPSDGSECTDGPAAYHAYSSGMYIADTDIPLPRLELPIPLMIDNTACQTILGNVMQPPKVKHVSVRFHCVWGWVRAGYLSQIHVDTTINLAEIFTKPLAAIHAKVMVIVGMGETFRPHPSGAAQP